MPLYLKGELVNKDVSNVKQLVERFPIVKSDCDEFVSQPVRDVGKVGLLYVHQREYATVSPQDDYVKVIGSEDATTCHIVILRDKDSGVTSLSHFDGSGVKTGLSSMVESMAQMAGNKPHLQLQIEMYLIGGFLDERGSSEKITQELLDASHRHAASIHLCLACVSDLNNQVVNGLNVPIIYGAGVDVKTGDVYPATFSQKGPDLTLRNARTFCGEEKVLEIYSSDYREIRIGPFSYTPIRHADFFATAPAKLILKYLSTSPHCEPPSFVDDVRRTMHYLVDHPEPLKTVFPQNSPRIYRPDSGGNWNLA